MVTTRTWTDSLARTQVSAMISTGNIEVLSANKTLTTADSGKIFLVTANTAYTVTVAANLPRGFNVGLAQWGTSAITLASASGATNRSLISETSAQYKMISVLVMNNNIGLTAAEYIVGEV